ncbi:MAG: RHS repeat protein, partial [Candidatus Phytoplasma sp.]|nr:RHS repeat protein [Phytoplasma sp.]
MGNGSSEIKATDETRLLGDKSLKILNQAANSLVNQNIYLKKGSYRLSVWVKNESSIGKAKVSVTSNSLSSHVLSQKTGQWEKITLDFMLTNQETVKISLENLILNTTTYFDNVELSEGFIDTRYNVLANHSFEEGFSNWETRGASSASNTVPNQTGAVFGETHLKIVGDSFENRYARQVVTNFLTEGETYMVGAWAKANAAPSSATGGLNKNRFFGLEIHITKENDDDSIGTVSYYLPFNASIREWQYQMTAIEIPYKTLEVTVALRYQGTGEALFDNVQLYHDDLKTAYSYNLSNGNLLEKQSAGKVTSYTYDYNNRVTSVTENNQKLNIGYQYNNISQLSLNNVKASYTYTSKNQVKETILGDQSKEWFKTSVGYTTDFQYINESMDEFGHKTKYQVNHLTGLIDMIENANQDKTYFTYDSFGNLIKQEEIENLTNAKIIKDMTYDEVYRLKSISIDGVTYEFGYDQLDRVTNIKIAGIDYLTLSYLEDIHMLEKYQTYKLGSQAYGNNDTYYFTYDKQDNISKISLNHIDLYEYIYDQKNRLTMYKDLRSNDIYFYSYDLANRLEQIVDQNDNKVIYEYDGLGNIRSSDYRYQGVNRKVYYIYNQFTGEYEYTYYQVSNQEIRKEYQIDQNDTLRRIKKINLIVGTSLNLSQEMSYLSPGTNSGNTSLLIDKITYKQNNLTNDTHQFKYDQLGNIIEIKITGRSNELYNYTYDGFGRLIQEDIYLEGYERTLTYTYDQRGNITSIKTYLYRKITEKPLKETKISYHQGAWKDQINEISYFMNGELIKTDVYTYDQIGNVLSITQNQLTNHTKSEKNTQGFYWEGRRLVSQVIGDITYQYTYNDQGIRTSKTINNILTEYFLEGMNVLSEK